MTQSNKPKQIVAIGGAMAKSLSASRLLLSYVLSLPGKENPKLLHINTASGNRDSSALALYRMLAGCVPCEASELAFFDRTPPFKQMRDLVLSQDVIFANGGNTKSMLAVWRDYGLPEVLREAWEAGIIMSGSSAGGICWFEQCLTDSYDVEFTALDCMGFLPGSACPHFDGEKGRRETYHRMVLEGTLKPGIAIDERVAVHYVDHRIKSVITTAQGTGAYLVYPQRAGGIFQGPVRSTLVS